VDYHISPLDKVEFSNFICRALGESFIYEDLTVES
jgi:hypothetical protein